MIATLASLLAVVFSAALSLWMMIAGWGLTPVSWPVIIMGYLLTIFPTLIVALVKDRR